MNKITRVAVAVLALSLLSTAGFAGQKKKPAAAAPTCPVCKMTLSSKKTKTDTVAVKIKGKTYYCCAGCKMNSKKKK